MSVVVLGGGSWFLLAPCDFMQNAVEIVYYPLCGCFANTRCLWLVLLSIESVASRDLRFCIRFVMDAIPLVKAIIGVGASIAMWCA